MTRNKAAVFLWFDSDAEAAAKFYTETFPDSHVDKIIRIREGVSGAPT